MCTTMMMRQSGQFCERSWTQLKSQWNKIHHLVQKFNGCYKQVDKYKRSGISEKDVLTDAHMIYSQVKNLRLSMLGFC